MPALRAVRLSGLSSIASILITLFAKQHLLIGVLKRRKGREKFFWTGSVSHAHLKIL
jgi:hypothetical protein